MISTTNLIIFSIIFVLILILVYINKNKLFDKFINYSEFTYKPDELKDSTLDENGFLKNEFNKDGMYPSYWYNYSNTDSRSKCFACDAESNLMHGSNCIDCEKKGGRPVDKLLNRVLTR